MKNTDICYDTKLKKYRANKVNGETKYYIGAAKICPRCNNYIVGYPALSRVDNKTEICSKCGNLEALEIFIKRGGQQVYFKVGEVRPYVLDKVVHLGKILKVNEKDNTYEIEDIWTGNISKVKEEDIFLGDD